MKRLLADAEAISGIKYDISSYADVVDAIHVIQTEMGITGTTAKEASQTISGSISAAKGAWQNFLVGMADGSQNMDVLVGNLASSVVTVGKNLIPRITTTLKSIGKLIAKQVPKMLAEIPKQLNKLGKNIKKKLPELVEIGLDGIVDMTDKMKKQAPNFLQAGLDFIIKIAEGLMKALPKLIEKLPVIINNMAENMKNGSSKLLPAAAELIRVLGVGLINAIPTLVKNIPKIITSVVNAFTSFAWGTVGKGMIDSIADGIKNAISTIKSAINKVLDGIKSTISTKFDSIKSTTKSKWNNIKLAIVSPIEKARDKIKAAIKKIKSFFNITLKFKKLKMPHITISWKTKGIFAEAAKFIGAKGVPKFGVEWYAKGAIFDKPTLFATPYGVKGVGEAGAEAVTPIDKLQDYVSTAVASQNESIVYYLQKMTEIMADYFPQVVDGMDRPLRFDADGMASAMAVPMDKYLGRLKAGKDRGR